MNVGDANTTHKLFLVDKVHTLARSLAESLIQAKNFPFADESIIINRHFNLILNRHSVNIVYLIWFCSFTAFAVVDGKRSCYAISSVQRIFLTSRFRQSFYFSPKPYFGSPSYTGKMDRVTYVQQRTRFQIEHFFRCFLRKKNNLIKIFKRLFSACKSFIHGKTSKFSWKLSFSFFNFVFFLFLRCFSTLFNQIKPIYEQNQFPSYLILCFFLLFSRLLWIKSSFVCNWTR